MNCNSFTQKFSMPRSPVIPPQRCVKLFDYPYQAGILGSCRESLPLLLVWSQASWYSDDIPRNAVLWFGLQQVVPLLDICKLVYPGPSKSVSFQWIVIVESPSLSVPPHGLSSLGRVWTQALLLVRSSNGSDWREGLSSEQSRVISRSKL